MNHPCNPGSVGRENTMANTASQDILVANGTSCVHPHDGPFRDQASPRLQAHRAHGAPAKVALDGLWTNPASWQNGTAPVSSPALSVAIAPGVISKADVGGTDAHEPFLVRRIALSGYGDRPSTLVVSGSSALDTPYLKADSVYGGRIGNTNKIAVGQVSYLVPMAISRTATMEIAHDAINVNFVLTGIAAHRDLGFGTLVVGQDVHGSTFTFDGRSDQALVLEHPPLRFMRNEIHVTAFPQPRPFTSGSGAQTIALGGLDFDRADFIPYAPPAADGEISGAVVLSEQDVPVYALTNVHATGYGGTGGGYFSAGYDPARRMNYIVYGRGAETI